MASITCQVAITKGNEALLVVVTVFFSSDVFSAQLAKLVPTASPTPVKEAFFKKFLRFIMLFFWLIRHFKYKFTTIHNIIV